MKFFVPLAESDQAAGQLLQNTRELAQETMKQVCTSRRIFRIKYRSGRREQVAEVGRPFPMTDEIVMAIFDAGPMFILCTMRHGSISDLPAWVARPDVLQVVDFDDDQPSQEAHQPSADRPWGIEPEISL